MTTSYNEIRNISKSYAIRVSIPVSEPMFLFIPPRYFYNDFSGAEHFFMKCRNNELSSESRKAEFDRIIEFLKLGKECKATLVELVDSRKEDEHVVECVLGFKSIDLLDAFNKKL